MESRQGNPVKYITLSVNCGYARAAMRELTPKRKHRGQVINKQQRQAQFQKLFQTNPNFGLPDNYFVSSATTECHFDRDCNKIIQIFACKWHPKESREEYEKEFCTNNWKRLPEQEMKKHTLANCKGCFQDNKCLQMKFPQAPYFNPVPLVTINNDKLKELGEGSSTRQALSDISQSFTEAFNTPFVNALVKHGKQGLKFKSSATERKQKLRKIYRKVRDKENDAKKKTAAIAVLTETNSMRSYNRKRKLQCFETPPAKRSRQKSHSPDFSKVTWNKEAVIEDLTTYPSAPPPINWQKFAQEHGVPGRNRGQVVKELAKQSGIDISRLEGSTPKSRTRSAKRRLPGGEISAPADPPPHVIKKEWMKMIETGELSLGLPCVSYKLVRYTPKDGQLEKHEVTVTGRKFPLTEIRRKLLAKHERYMRLQTDEEIEAMTITSLHTFLRQVHHPFDSSATADELRNIVRKLQRTRTLVLWHDHGTILKLGCILMTIHVVYDQAVFYTPSECTERGQKVQPLVERPTPYIIAAGSSCAQDQAALLQDRLDCLLELSCPTKATNGVDIHDELVFCIGDHPAQQYERGMQQGGVYRCACTCRSSMFEDLAHALQCEWRSLKDIQQVALAGKLGKQVGVLKPFENLKVAQIREELHQRQKFDTDKPKQELQGMLTNILKGVQRVPTILLLNPKQELAELNLEKYTVLDSEPLHDMKGHLSNLFKELPHILPSNIRASCKDIIASNSRDKVTGADYRTILFELYLHFSNLTIVDKSILLLLRTAIKLSELLYMSDDKRTPKCVLQLYNVSWLHHELCSKLFTTFHGDLSRSTFFGSYLHSLVVHAPLQFEIISLRSINTENQERIFNQARRIATGATNRHPQNIISTIVLRLQAKAEYRDIFSGVDIGDSMVAKAGAQVKGYTGTCITPEFLQYRSKSWQAHLQRISKFLLPGEGVWWEKTSSGYHFFDSDEDPDYHKEGPTLMHFRSTHLKQVILEQNKAWDSLLQQSIAIPALRLYRYNTKGNLMSIQHIDGQEDQISGSETELEREDSQFPLENQCTVPVEDDQSTADGQTHPTTTTEEVLSRELVEFADTLVDASDNKQITRKYKTKHATEIAKVIGETEELNQFDEIRHRIKSKERPTTYHYTQHENLLAKLQTAIMKERTSLMKKIRDVEAQHFKEYAELPKEDCNHQLTSLMSKHRKANTLLKALRLDI